MPYDQTGHISNHLLLLFPDANQEQGSTAGGDATAQAQDQAQMVQATVEEVADEVEQQPQDDPLDHLIDIVEVNVHEDDEVQEEDDDEEEYDPEEDEYLHNFINKDSLVGISLGGAKQINLDQAGQNLFRLYLFLQVLKKIDRPQCSTAAK